MESNVSEKREQIDKSVKGVAMFFFKRRKKEKVLEKKYDEIEQVVLTEQDKKDPHKVEHFVIERLEQILEAQKEVNEQRAEYKIITSYLNDIHTIDELPQEEHDKIVDMAQNIVALNQARNEFIHAEKKISDAQYVQMQQEEAEIPNAIKRLKANETYLEVIKKDLKYLEREKSEWMMYKDSLKHERKSLQHFLYVLIGVIISVAVLFFILQFVLKLPMQMAWTIFLFLSVLSISVTYIKMLNAESEQRRAENNGNKAIALQNKVKMKSISVTNAVDYAHEKYHVTSSNELNRIWEAYLEAIKEREKFERNSDDLEYFSTRLIRELSKYRLYDARVWVPQAIALVDHKEMVEITHNLVERRQKLRTRMEYSIELVQKQREDVDKLLSEVKVLKPKIIEIINAIDQLGQTH